LVRDTILHDLERIRRRLRLTGVAPFVERLVAQHYRREERAGRGDPALASEFQRRREVNVERLGRVNRLIAQSPRVAQIYRSLGVSGERMSTLPFTLKHIDRLRPRSLSSPPETVTFGTLNGCASPTKGSETIRAALRALRAAGAEGTFRLRVFGYVHEDVREELTRFEGVRLHGLYGVRNLDGLLDDVDVGLMPSMWEEAFGYSGLEMIAKGIPLIANPLGGIVEYVREEETGWLNRACSGEGLAELMLRLVRDPQRVLDMHRRVVARHDELVLPFERHFQSIEEIYRELT
jgi:glycosyltransferase involved in cell wall biosynthesis